MGNINNDSNKEDNPTLYAIPISEAESNEPTEIIKNDAKENSSVNKEESFSKEKPFRHVLKRFFLLIDFL